MIENIHVVSFLLIIHFQWPFFLFYNGYVGGGGGGCSILWGLISISLSYSDVSCCALLVKRLDCWLISWAQLWYITWLPAIMQHWRFVGWLIWLYINVFDKVILVDYVNAQRGCFVCMFTIINFSSPDITHVFLALEQTTKMYIHGVHAHTHE